MSKTEKVTRLRSEPAGAVDNPPRLAVTLTVDELRALVADAVREHVQDDDGALLTVEDAAKFIQQSPTYVYRNWRDMGGRKLGKNLRFSKPDLKKWAAEKKVLT